MKRFLVSMAVILAAFCASAQSQFVSISDPEGKTTVYVGANNGVAWYSVDHNGTIEMPASRLGLRTNAFDFTNLRMVEFMNDAVEWNYTMDRSKTSKVKATVGIGVVAFENADGQRIEVEFCVGRNDIAFRYLIPKKGETGSIRVMEELTEFNFIDSPAHDGIATFLTPQSDAMVGWKRTKPSYEEFYGIGRTADLKSDFGHGYTFPCLFKVGDEGWVLISETGVGANYCGSRLSDSRLISTEDNGTKDPADDKLYYSYKIEYPMPEENNGNGTVEPALALPGATPWRTITIAESLQPIVETTVTWDVVDPVFETGHKYEYGKSTWSWIVWQDPSINMEDQIKYIDLAAAMGFRYVLVDSGWDMNIGKEGMEELVSYARSKGVDVFLWYSSSGWWNDIVQSPVNIMSNPVPRKKEMRWMHEIGVKGIKVDFFGGDKQETMRHYEAILSDADDYGLMVIFHGCTLPRGWERMYPNYVGSEAVRASENLVFLQSECDQEAQAACLHPFIRNTVGCMEFGGCFLNKRLDRSNSRGSVRRTTDIFQLATCVLFQNPVQNFAIAPNNLEDAPEVCLDFLREVPTTWDETRLIEGYPGKHVALARRHGNRWYIAVVNAEEQSKYYNVWEMIYGLRDRVNSLGEAKWTPVKDSIVKIYEGGNEPCVRNVPVSELYRADINVPVNDGVVIVFDTTAM